MISRIYDGPEKFSFTYRERSSDGREGRLKGCLMYVRLIFEFLDQDLMLTISRMFDEKNGLDDWLKETFSNTTCIDESDSLIGRFRELDGLGMIDLRVLPGVGKERFAEIIWQRANGWLHEQGLFPRITIKTVEVQENQRVGALYLQG